MIVTVVAVMCKLAVAQATIAPDRDCTPEEVKIEEIVTDSDKDESFSFQGCMVGQAQVADWKAHHPVYLKDEWRVARIKCVPGHYVIKGSI